MQGVHNSLLTVILLASSARVLADAPDSALALANPAPELTTIVITPTVAPESIENLPVSIDRVDQSEIAQGYVFLSGMIVHRQSAHEVAARCAALGKTVIAGGPLFTTGHQEFAEIPHFVLGEAEDVIGQLVGDMGRGAPKPIYRALEWPDVRKTPVPRWDLVRMRDYVTMPVQFSRGCPFSCEFCDIVIMNGRVPRTKDPAQVVR